MWSIECVCSSLRNVIMAFFILVIGSMPEEESRAPNVLAKSELIGVCQIQSTWACFDHISLIQTQNYAPFFLWTPCSSRNILSKFQMFYQPARPVLKVSILAEFIRACSNSEYPSLFRIPYYSRNILSNVQKFSQLPFCSVGSLCQIVWSTDFGGFGTQILLGSGP